MVEISPEGHRPEGNISPYKNYQKAQISRFIFSNIDRKTMLYKIYLILMTSHWELTIACRYDIWHINLLSYLAKKDILQRVYSVLHLFYSVLQPGEYKRRHCVHMYSPGFQPAYELARLVLTGMHPCFAFSILGEGTY